MEKQAKEDSKKPEGERWLFSGEREDEELHSEGKAGSEGVEEEKNEVDEEVED